MLQESQIKFVLFFINACLQEKKFVKVEMSNPYNTGKIKFNEGQKLYQQEIFT